MGSIDWLKIAKMYDKVVHSSLNYTQMIQDVCKEQFESEGDKIKMILKLIRDKFIIDFVKTISTTLKYYFFYLVFAGI